MKKDKFGNFLIWQDDQLSLYRVKQPNQFQYFLRLLSGVMIYGDTIGEVTESFKALK